MSTFLRSKQINARTKNLINGYIRECQNKLFDNVAQDNSYYNIPPLINICCMAFYEIFTWYREQYGEGLKFLSDTEVIVEKNTSWSTCMFENVISNEVCNNFDITFKIISFGDGRKHLDFVIGYTKENTLEKSITNWKQCLGEGENFSTSRSWAFWNSSLIWAGDFVHEDTINYSAGDLIKISFDFEAMKVKVYHNDQERDCQDLNTTKVWVGLSLMYEGCKIEMIEYKYDD